MEINGIPNSISDNHLEPTVINVLSKATNVHVTADDIDACHRIGKSKGNLKKAVVRFINRKHCKCSLVNRKKLKSFNSESIGLPNVKLYFNKNSTKYNNTLPFYGRKLKRAGFINSIYTLNGTVHILQTVGERPIKVNICWSLNPANICWSSRRLEDVFKTCLEDVFNTSSA